SVLAKIRHVGPGRILLGGEVGPLAGATLLPYTTLFRSAAGAGERLAVGTEGDQGEQIAFSRQALGSVLAIHGQDDHFTATGGGRCEEHTSELQSRGQVVCGVLLEKKDP